MLIRHRLMIALLGLRAGGATAAFLWASYGSSLTTLLDPTGAGPSVARHSVGRHRHHASRPRPTGVVTGRRRHADGGSGRRVDKPRRAAPARDKHGGGPSLRAVAVYLVLMLTLVVVALGLAAVRTVNRRFANRFARCYRRYEIHLSMHDDAKPADLDDMIEAIAAALRPPRSERTCNGQPLIAIDLDYAPGEQALEWTLSLTCEQRIAATLEGILTQAYPDIWLGARFEERRRSLGARRPTPGYVLRLRKRRAHVYPLSRAVGRTGDRALKPTSPLEGIARAQVAAAAASSVRFAVWPVIDRFEARSRIKLRTREKQLERAAKGMWEERASLAMSDRRELASAVEVQGRAQFHLELQVAAGDFQTANAIAASVMARRGENHLHRCYLRMRQRMYRNRFATAYPPWLPAPSRRDIVSAGEIAYLFELPTARMKSVPVRRRTRPRIPAPAEIKRYERPSAAADELHPEPTPVPPGPSDPARAREPARRAALHAVLAPFDR